MNNTTPQIVPAHEVMKDASMGTLGKEKQDFFDMVLKNAITKKTILNVPILFDETDLEYNQPFAQVTMHHLNMGQNMSEKQKQKWWSKNKKLAKLTLNEKRSNVTCGLKKIFFGTYQD